MNLNINFINLNIFFDKFWNHIDLSIEEQTYVRGKPRPYILSTINIFNNLIKKNKIILEVGSIRRKMKHDIYTFDPKCCNDGHSSYFWNAYTNATIYTVDIDKRCREMIINDDRLKNVKAFTQDAIEFGKNFNHEIDLLFLDAWDVVPKCKYAEKHLEMYEVIKNKLSSESLILIDDTDILNGGKGKLLFKKLLDDGYEIMFFGRQTLFKKNNLKLVNDSENNELYCRRNNEKNELFFNYKNSLKKINFDENYNFQEIKNIFNHKNTNFYYKIINNKIIIILYNNNKIYKWEILF